MPTPDAVIEHLYRSQGSKLQSMVAGRYRQRHHDAEDAVQEAFVIALKKRHDVAASPSPAGFICNITKNKGMQKISYQRRHPVSSLNGSYKGAETTVDPVDHREPSVLHRMITEEQRRQIRAVIKDLPDQVQTVVDLYVFEGKTYAQIAELLHRNSSWVNRRMDDARNLLGQKSITLPKLHLPRQNMSAKGKNLAHTPPHKPHRPKPKKPANVLHDLNPLPQVIQQGAAPLPASGPSWTAEMLEQMAQHAGALARILRGAAQDFPTVHV